MGVPTLSLTLSCDHPQAMLAVRLSDVAPDGKATRVTYGLLNLTHRDSDEQPSELVPGKQYRVQIPMNGIAQRFPEGHQLRISISTSYWPLAWLSPAPAQVDITLDNCTLHLPVRTAADDDNTFAFEPPEAAPALAITTLAPSQHNWLLHRDLATKKSTLEVINNQGCFRINDTGTEIHRSAREYYSTVTDDFTSARGETITESHFKRDDWDTEVYTRTVLTCTESHFLVHAQLDAYEQAYRVFSKNWSSKIPRDHL